MDDVRSVGETILALGDTPERREIANAYHLEQTETRALIAAGFNDLKQSGKQRDEQLGMIDADIKLTLNRMHHMAGMVQGLIVKIDDQALYASLLDERLTNVENEATALRNDLEAMKRRLEDAGL